MNSRIFLLLFLLLPSSAHSQPAQSNILSYVPPLIAAAKTARYNNFSVGAARSDDLDAIDINHKFNSWLISRIRGRQEIRLKVFEKMGAFDVPALWALAIRTDLYPKGRVSVKDMEVKLMSNYTFNSGLCCVNTLPFSSFDQADETYIGVEGFVDFESDYKGTFTVGFQKIVKVGEAGVTVVPAGASTLVSGCWYIAGEQGVSGCGL